MALLGAVWTAGRTQILGIDTSMASTGYSGLLEEGVLQEQKTLFLEYKAGLGLSVPWRNELALRTLKLPIWFRGVCTEDLCPLSRWPTFLQGHLLPVEAEISLLCEHEHVCACGGQGSSSAAQHILVNLTSKPQGAPVPTPIVTGSHSCACVSMFV